MHKNKVKTYCQSLNNTIAESSSPSRIDKLLKDLDPDIGELIKGMLTFNPEERWNTQQCVSHKLFDTLRDESSLEIKAKKLVDLSECDGPGMFDYESYTDHGFSLE